MFQVAEVWSAVLVATKVTSAGGWCLSEGDNPLGHLVRADLGGLVGNHFERTNDDRWVRFLLKIVSFSEKSVRWINADRPRNSPVVRDEGSALLGEKVGVVDPAIICCPLDPD